jgi:hypothetical protein
MGFLSSVGVEGDFTGGISGQGMLFWGGIVFLAFVILIIAGAIAFFYYARKAKKTAFKNEIPIFVSLNGKHKKVGTDWAKEIYVPDSNISLFYLKINKIYIARPTRAMSKNEYWYSISENGEWVNFDLSTNPKDNTLAKANYDHRDTRYAYVNLKEIIKKNYKDKSLVWWKDPVIMNIISFVIMSVIFVGACWFLISKMGHLIGQMGPFLDRMDIIADKLSGAVQNAQNINSGVTQIK